MKIAFTGPESSGKTSLSKAVAAKLNAQWHPEYAREYLLERNGEYNYDDIERIAVKQEEVRQQNKENGINIYDTEAIVLYIWSKYKYQKCSPTVEELLKNQSFDHYFLCSPNGIPWEDDPLREHPNQREELFLLYLEKMKELQLNFTILEGDFEARVQKALETIES